MFLRNNSPKTNLKICTVITVPGERSKTTLNSNIPISDVNDILDHNFQIEVGLKTMADIGLTKKHNYNITITGILNDKTINNNFLNLSTYHQFLNDNGLISKESEKLLPFYHALLAQEAKELAQKNQNTDFRK